MSTLKRNYIFSLANTVAGLLFPLITFPYASRILLPDGIGQVNFFASIVAYITLLTSLGIPMYAIREIAKVRDNEAERNKVAKEILLLHAGLTVLGYLAVAILCMTVEKIQVDIPLFLILSATVFFTAIGAEWFYQGVEEFKYITIRGLITKTLAVILLFVFVKSREDLLWYGAYTVFGVLGGNIFNFIRLRKYLLTTHSPFAELHPLRHLRPALRIFVLNLVISIYINLNTVMLGFFKETSNVGYFTAATKLTTLTLSLVSCLGTVMLPRLSNLIAQGQREEFNKLTQKAMKFVIALSLPLCIGLIITAPHLIPLFCGEAYTASVTVLQTIAPVIVCIAISNILGIQILYPQGKESIVIKCTAIGALLNVCINLVLIPMWAQNGSAIASLAAEFTVTASMAYIGRKYIPVKFSLVPYKNYLIGGAIMCALLAMLTPILSSYPSPIQLASLVLVGAISYGIYLYLRKDEIFSQLLHFAFSKLKK